MHPLGLLGKLFLIPELEAGPLLEYNDPTTSFPVATSRPNMDRWKIRYTVSG